MYLEFTKMNGAGNDFIFVDNRSKCVRLTAEQIARLCHRHRGIGADGIGLLIPCESGKADWAWNFYNADGSPAAMCGNGSRCFARFIQRLTGARDKVTFETGAGVITATFQGERVTVNLTAPKDFKFNETLPLSGGKTATVHFVNTGVEHAVLFVEDVDKAKVVPVGSEIRHHAHFSPKGTNANFVQIQGPSSIRVRTYERGVEAETLACGTGVTASALISAELHGFTSPVKVRVQGGDLLEVGFDKSNAVYTNVRLTGPAEFVFDGRIQLA